MQKSLHPTYNKDVKVECICGNKWTVGSTLTEINTNICSNCHPFYTGNEKIVDSRGRVDRYKKQLEKTAGKKSPKAKAAK